MKVRINDDNESSGYRWVNVRPGNMIELSAEIAGRKPALKAFGKLVKKKSKKKDEDYAKEVESIKGIGKKTAEDIVKLYPDVKSLKAAIKKDEDLPLRDDVAKKLERHFK